GGTNAAAQLGALRRLVRPLRRVLQLTRDRSFFAVHRIVDREELHALLADMIDAQVGRDLEEPAGESVNRVVALDRRESLDERFLRQVARLLGVAHHLAAQIVYRVLILAEQQGIRRLIAALAAFDEQQVFLLHRAFPSPVRVDRWAMARAARSRPGGAT